MCHLGDTLQKFKLKKITNMRQLKIIGILAVIFAKMTLLTSCGDYKVPNQKVVIDTTDTTSINMSTIEISVRDTSEEEICRTEKIKWKPGSDETILLDPQSDVIYLGSVIDASSLQNGKFTPIVGKRKPIKISISIPNLDSTKKEVSNPSLSSVREAIKSILTSHSQGSQPAQLSVDCYEVFSKEHLNLLFKSKYSAGFGKVEAGFNFDNQQVKSRYILDLAQVYYSLDIDAPGANGFFEKKPENIGNVSPAFISSMKYGRKVLMTIETSSNIQGKEFDLKSEFNLFAGSGELSANSISKKLIEDKSIKLLVIGGNPNNPYDIFKAVADKDSLYHILKRDAVWSIQNLGVPLSYTVKHCYDASVFTLTQYGEFVARKCEIKPKGEFILNAPDLTRLCPDHIGGDREFNGNGPITSFKVSIFNNGNDIYAKVFCDWVETKSDYTHGIFNRDILIGHIPDDLKVLEILSPKEINWNYTDNNGHEAEGNTFNENVSPIRYASIMGDTDDDDDLSFNCGIFMNTGILRIQFYPIKLQTRKIK